MEDSQRWDGQKFESNGAGVDPSVRITRPKPTAMGQPMEDPWDTVAEAIVVIGLVNQAADKCEKCEGDKGGWQKSPEACSQAGKGKYSGWLRRSKSAAVPDKN